MNDKKESKLTIQESWLEGEYKYNNLNFFCIYGLRRYFDDNNLKEPIIRGKSREIYKMFDAWRKPIIESNNREIENRLSQLGDTPEIVKQENLLNQLIRVPMPEIYEYRDPPCNSYSDLLISLALLDKYEPALKIIGYECENMTTSLATIAITEFAKPYIPGNAVLEFMEFQSAHIFDHQVELEKASGDDFARKRDASNKKSEQVARKKWLPLVRQVVELRKKHSINRACGIVTERYNQNRDDETDHINAETLRSRYYKHENDI